MDPTIPLASLGPIAKSGQVIPPQNVQGDIQGFPPQLAGNLADVLGISDAAKALRGEMTPEEAQTFALGALPGALVGPEAKAAGTAAEEAIPLASKVIRAFHGSPYDFNAFDLSKIGTGEGAQAYGHGLYFAENPGVAKSYRDALAQNNWQSRDVGNALFDELASSGTIQGKVPFGPNQTLVTKDQLAEGMLSGKYNIFDVPPSMQKAVAARLPQGKTYEVNINADPEHFLDWDKPLPENVVKIVSDKLAATGIGDVGVKAFWEKAGNTPQGLVTAERYLGAENLIPDLRDAGIPGIKYLDQGSRGDFKIFSKGGDQYGVMRPDGTEYPLSFSKDDAQAEIDRQNKYAKTSNYVVFNDKLIDIIKKYGLAGLLGGGGGAGAMMQQPQQPQVPLSGLQMQQ